jgi:C-terminal processing protease CtpA/Prc
MHERPMKDRLRQFSYVLLCLSLSVSATPLALADLDNEPILKPDVPKLDTTVKKNAPLKGMVRHNEQSLAKPTKPLNGAVAGNGSPNLNVRTANEAQSFLKGKTKQDKEQSLKADAQSGIGIIGVKFVMAFGRPPIINRVFPGTPAFENGLKPNDIIVAVDGVPTYGLTKEEVFNMIVGTPNTPVSISLMRKSDFQVRRMMRMDFNDLTDPRVRRDYQSM